MEEDNIIVKWAQEDVETSYNLLNNNNFGKHKIDPTTGRNIHLCLEFYTKIVLIFHISNFKSNT